MKKMTRSKTYFWPKWDLYQQKVSYITFSWLKSHKYVFFGQILFVTWCITELLYHLIENCKTKKYVSSTVYRWAYDPKWSSKGAVAATQVLGTLVIPQSLRIFTKRWFRSSICFKTTLLLTSQESSKTAVSEACVQDVWL